MALPSLQPVVDSSGTPPALPELQEAWRRYSWKWWWSLRQHRSASKHWQCLWRCHRWLWRRSREHKHRRRPLRRSKQPDAEQACVWWFRCFCKHWHDWHWSVRTSEHSPATTAGWRSLRRRRCKHHEHRRWPFRKPAEQACGRWPVWWRQHWSCYDRWWPLWRH